MWHRALSVCLALVLATPVAGAQFNPQGRRKPPPGSASKAPPRTGPRTPAPRSDTPKKPGDEALIARYTGIALSQPGAKFPLQRLAELVRERDGNLDKLIADFEQRAKAKGPARWNALVALAGLYVEHGETARAVATYEQAIEEKPGNPVARLALAHLYSDRSQKKPAREQLEKALPHLDNAAEREQVLRTLMVLSLDLKEHDAARRFHRELVRRAKGSFFVRAELGRELLLRHEYERAVVEYRDVVQAATGDNRVLAPALRDLGRALTKLGQRPEALKVLRRALNAAGGQSGVKREIYDVIVELYRADEKLHELIAELEKEGGADTDKLRLLGSLYEETGRVEQALRTYRQALGRDKKDVGLRLKVLQLLQIQGELDEVIREFEALIQAAPRNPDYVFQLAEALIQRGDRDKALAHLSRLEGRSLGDEETLAALIDFYERVGEKERAVHILKRLTQQGSTDPRHLVDLGSRYWEEGEKERAQATWQRVKTVTADQAAALHTLGEVYLEHDLVQEALDALRQAMKLKPGQVRYKKSYALALERTGASADNAAERVQRYEEARRIWEELLREAQGNDNQAREARQHIVTLWSLSGQLSQRVAPLERRLQQKPPDLEAGRLLAELEIRLRRYPAAERTLRKVIQYAPGDLQSLLALERVLVQSRKLKEAIAVLKKLVSVEPKRAREYYQRMAQYAAELYQDDDAIAYAARAVELSPDDADAHQKLGEMYRRRQDLDKAAAAFRAALAKNDRLFSVYFQLAELLIGRGEIDEADRLLRRVIRASPDEELVAQAARLSMQVNLGRGTLESLEKELLPVALGNPQRPIYRRLLVDIYGAIAFPLVQQTKAHDENAVEQAKSALKRVGERAVKPLLDALGDERDAQQRIAIELLAHIDNKSAGPALFAYATGPADPSLRVRAMVAVGALKDPDLLTKLSEVLVPNGQVRADESDPLSVAAAWSVARMESPKARPLLDKLLTSEAPSIRALAALGLALLGEQRAARSLAEIARSVESGPLPRAAAAFALGQLGARSELDALNQLAEATHPSVRAAAIIALSRLGAKTAPRIIGEALVSPDPELASAARAAALVYSTGDFRMPGDALSVPQGRIDAFSVLERLRPSGYSAAETLKALERLTPAIAQAAVAAVQSSPERARAVAAALLSDQGTPTFRPLAEDFAGASPEIQKGFASAGATIAEGVVQPFIGLANHPSPSVRSLSVQFLATRKQAAANRVVIQALVDDSELVQRAALSAVTRFRTEGAPAAVTSLLSSAERWPTRMRAARALGTLSAGKPDRATVNALSSAAEKDGFALVRQAAVEALFKVDPNGSHDVLHRVEQSDPEPRVRAAARAVLQK